MLVSEFLQTRAASGLNSVDALQQNSNILIGENNVNNSAAANSEGITFAEALKNEIEASSRVGFSNHALKRIESRSIDISANDRLARLNKGVEIAAEKGSEESLILVDSTAFVVSVKNNKVITTMGQEDIKGSIFTNIDSTVII